jgi:hypothetical protein
MQTQYEIIVKLARRGWISPVEAFHAGAGMKLSSRVSELKQKGYTVLDRWHPSKKFKLYRIVGAEPK